MFTDGYSQAVPVRVLRDAAAMGSPVCARHGASARRQVCPRLLGEHCIIEAIAEHLSRQVAAPCSPAEARPAARTARGSHL